MIKEKKNEWAADKDVTVFRGKMRQS